MDANPDPMASSSTAGELSHHCLAACLMTDAERYTALTETMEPEAVVAMVNRYFEALFGPVLANGGVVSDVKGDGVLAVWNHTSAGERLKALVCKASLEIVEAVDKLNRQDPKRRLPTRLGVDFGPIALARVGALARYEYRPVGDPVNTANRLQELNKTLRTRILVSDALAQGAEGFLFRDLGRFRLRGKRAPTRVLELVGSADRCSDGQRELCREFGNAVLAYESGAKAEAEDRFRALRSKAPEDCPTLYYLGQLRSASARPRPATPRTWLSRLWWSGGHLVGRVAR